MPDAPVRVALLARPGEARDQLRRALTDFGAELVAEGDPGELDPALVASGRPGVVLVSLEPAIEDALDRFEDLLAAPDVEVIYDDAEVTRGLDGWDLARWARHLAAKLAGGDVLPPPPGDLDALEEFDVALEPGAPPTPAQQMDAEKLEDYAAESLDLSEWVPTTPSLHDVSVDAPAAGETAALDDAMDLELDLAGLEQAMTPQDDGAVVAPAVAATSVPEADDLQLLDIDAPLALAPTPTPAAVAPPPPAAPSLQLMDADAPLELPPAAPPPPAPTFADSSLELLDDDAPLDFAGTGHAATAPAGDDAALDLDFDDAGAEVSPPDGDDALALTLGDDAAPAGDDLALDLEDDAPAFAASGDDDALLDLDGDTAEFASTDDGLLELEDGAPLPTLAGDDEPLALDDADMALPELAAGAPLPSVDEVGELDLGSMDTLDLGLDVDLSALDAPPEPVAAAAPVAVAPPEEPLLADLELGDSPVKFSSFTDDDPGHAHDAGLDDDVAALAAQLDAFEANDQRQAAREPDFASHAATPPPASAPTPAAVDRPAPGARPAGGGFGNLELSPMDGDGPPMPSSEPVRPVFGGSAKASTLSLADENAPLAPAPVAAAPREAPPVPRTSHLSLTDEDAAPDDHRVADGALLVLAGLGGPDGVRQLLSALPPSLPVPVLLYQHLDTGKHERLVGQLAKASQLPLDLAVAGGRAHAGRVAVLQPGVGIRRDGRTIEFVAGSGLAGVVSALAPADSIVLVLSGADTTVVPAVLALATDGGHVLAQDPASCFDPVAAQAMIGAGATTAPLAELAQQIVDRWT